ncbi:unnamed protein product [Soboliphyme baturini]|uniref:ARID domain-containing protein n=1 Tax=Soboliphyme baturini TaxID=241478 RepID=A0A183J6X6_9BILA|nr:unnamed protein product [Soboliphyme baturini]
MEESRVRASVEKYLLMHPAYVRHLYETDEHRHMDLSGLKCVLRRFFERGCFNNGFVASRDFAILNRMIYRLSGPYRRHKFYQYVKSLDKIRRKIEQLRCYDVS